VKIVLTGATGFIGSHLLPELAAEHDVVAVARRPPDRAVEGVVWVEHDLTRSLAEARLPGRADAIVHLAQSKRYREFPDGADDVFAVNVRSTFELLQYATAAGVGAFVFASTGGVYGSGERALSEDDRLNPLNFYISSKYSAEALVRSYRQLFRAITFRFFFVYGPGQRGMLVPSLLERVVGGGPITIQGEPGLRLNPIFIRDAIRVFEPALALGRSELFNVAGDEVVTIRDLVRLMEEATGRQAAVSHAAAAGGEGDLVGDNTRMKELLGVTPATALRDGLRSML